MQPAFPVFGIFPPPAARANVFARLNCAGARLAADWREALVVQFVVRHAVLLHIGFNIVFGPVNQRVKFDKAVVFVPLDKLHILARHALLTAKAANPHFQALQGTLQRLNFADIAAQMPKFDLRK